MRKLLPLAVALLLVGGGCFGKDATPATNTQDGGYVGANGDATVPGANTNANANANTNGNAGGNTAAPAPRSATVRLNAVAGWNQSGSATLIDLPGNQTQITITLSGPNPDVAQPAAIYSGTCATGDAEAQYFLEPVVNGRSVTVLDVNIGALVDKSPQAIKIKRDPTDANAPFAACGALN